MKRGMVMRYTISAAVGLLIMFFILCAKSVFTLTCAYGVMVALCDAFFVSGVLLSCAGLLLVCSNGGTFDMLVYGVQLLFVNIRRNPAERKYKDFAEYRKVKSVKKHNVGYLLLVGVIMICISILFLVLSYCFA